ncbi:MAG: SDR family oxidoreductase [Alphaproteobacteria bacterium]
MVQSALITGAAKRIGKEIAIHLAKNHYNLALHYGKSAQKAKDLAQMLQSEYGIKAITIQADLSDETQVQKLIPQINDRFGTIDLLVNNASCFLRDSWDDSPAAVWNENLAVNLRAPFLLSSAFAKQAPKGSLIVNMLDSKLENLTPAFTSYTVAKSGLYALTKTLAQALAPNIRVNGIGPGHVIPSVHDTKETWEKAIEQTALKHATSIAEIAQTILWMHNTPSLTGQMIMLDGGEHLGWKFPH